METQTEDLLTLAHFAFALEHVGVSIFDVKDNPGPRLGREGGVDSPLVLIVTTYAKNAEGKRYIDSETREAATEVRRFRLAGDLRLLPNA